MNAEEKERLWEWTLHEDLLFSERQNLFLVAQSMLVAGYGAAVDAKGAAAAIAAIAVALTIAWAFVSWRQYDLVEYIQEHAKRELSEYGMIAEKRPKVEIRSRPIRSREVIAFVLPGLLLMLWILLLARLV
jgi:hypothetical protein